MKQVYVDKRFNAANLRLVNLVSDIGDEYEAQGYTLTTRQAYYQLVARGIIENTLQSYKRVAGLINDGKLAGLIDWDQFEDRTREFVKRGHWNDPAGMVEACADQFYMDMWHGQERRVYVIVEKEALVGVLNRACNRYDVPLLAARGYPSSTILRDFALTDIRWANRQGQSGLILHLGDHDPSGIDMTRDLVERLEMFAGMNFELQRIALNMQQVEEVNPPENPAKSSDSRFADYVDNFGESSWELDALEPSYLDNLLTSFIVPEIDREVWERREDDIRNGRFGIARAAQYMRNGCPIYDGMPDVKEPYYKSALDPEEEE